MKTSKILLAATLFSTLATLSIAGPGIDYWTRTKAAEQSAAKAKAPVTCEKCACCADQKK